MTTFPRKVRSCNFNLFFLPFEFLPSPVHELGCFIHIDFIFIEKQFHHFLGFEYVSLESPTAINCRLNCLFLLCSFNYSLLNRAFGY